MKIFLYCFIAFLTYSSMLLGKEPIDVNTEGIQIKYHTISKSYSLWNKKEDTHRKGIKYVQLIASYYQILDANNSIFYINPEGEEKLEVQDYWGVCGTVPHYELEITRKNGFYIVMSDETFYDAMNEVPAQEINRVSIADADSVVFINGMSKYTYTSNYNVGGLLSIEPTELILIKAGKHSLLSDPSKKYDRLIFSNYGHIITEKNSLQGYANIIEPKFKKVGAFDYGLAPVEYPNGGGGYIDLEGNEYPFN